MCEAGDDEAGVGSFLADFDASDDPLDAAPTLRQRRGRRDAEDIVEAVGATPIENLGATIMAVGAQQDLGAGQ